MALAKPPKTATDRRAEALINRAPAVQSTKGGRPQPPTEVTVSVRIPEAMLDEIDVIRGRRPIKTSRQTWLMEAVHAKWEREKKASR
jgi:hypothetical protein